MANALTLARIGLALPIFLMLTFGGVGWALFAFALFLLAAVTDFLDGWVARRYATVSPLGAALDPIADKVLAIACLIALLGSGALPQFGGLGVVLIAIRELLVAGLREAVALRGQTLAVTGFGKTKTAVQLIAIAVLIAEQVPAFVVVRALEAGPVLLALAVGLTIFTGAQYIAKAFMILRAADPLADAEPGQTRPPR